MAFLKSLVKKTMNLSDSKNTEQIMYNNIEQKLNKWTIPKVNPTNVYNEGLIEFKQSYSIKMFEKSVIIGNVIDNIFILKNKLIKELKG